MRIYIDFDDVLFNTAAFKVAYKKAVCDCGIAEAIFEQAYQEAREREGVKNYSQTLHFEIMQEATGVSATAIQEAIRQLTSDTSAFLFEDSIPFLQKISRSAELFIVSFGTPGWQEKKILNSGVGSFVTKVCTGEFNKADAIGSCSPAQDDHDAYFLDDRVEYIDQVKTGHPRIQTILVKKPGARYDDQSSDLTDHVVYSLEEVFAIINTKTVK